MAKAWMKAISGLFLILSLFVVPSGIQQAFAVGNGPNYNGNETIKKERVKNYEEMVSFLEHVTSRSDLLELETIGQSVMGRDLFLVTFGTNPDNPTIVFLTQQHGNEEMVTEGALNVIKNLSTNSRQVRELADSVNVLFVPRLNPDGAEADVLFELEDYVGGGLLTRTNANGVDLNRDHTDLTQPETRALHENVLQKYDIDYLIDFHHQGTSQAIDGRYVSGSMLYPTNSSVTPEVVEGSKQLGKVVYDAVEARGFGLIGRYNGGTANTIARNGLASTYGFSTLLFEMRGMTDHSREEAVLGQKSNGYLIKQAEIAMTAAMEAIADGSILEADTSFWDELPLQRPIGEEEGE
ncbi:M14 family zinc carboxypeptidase [Halalkalibacterium halodurans]|uniref:M14 family zinc carboxypeptidase n=1 Tax=Halalkalibacterium halodurans TaxID=86665 RepID=UPI002E214A6B|nr:M14 family zinc carboxypeptidase [Halalkalibacterium halodurans]MED4123316.1 M14 family zinc carboxypeptidase [Halalkalibacterium halodurans]